MTLSFVTLTLDKYDGSGNPVAQGKATCQTSAPVTVPGGGSFPSPVTASFEDTDTAPTVRLLACDTPGSQPAGWYWVISYDWVPGSPGPDAVSVLAAGGPAQNLSSLAPPQGVMPAPTGTPTAGQVPVFTGEGYATVPGNGGEGGGSGTVTSASVVTANGFSGTVANPTTTPALTLSTTVPAGMVKSSGAALGAAAAGTDYVAPAGSGAALTGITAAQVGAASAGALSSEVTRAETAEGTLGTAISAETTRAETAEGLAAQKANNLSDLASAPTARTNLGLGTAATQASSAFDASGAATAAQTASLQKSSNLSDLASASTARTNLGLGSAATQAGSAFDAAGAAGTAQSNAETFATSAVGTETTRAEAAEGTLTTAAAAKVAKAGDTMTGKLSTTVTTVAFASTVTLPVTTNVLSLTLTGNCTINAPSSGNDGDLLRVRVIGANSHTVTWGTGWDWGTAGAPVLAGPRDRIVAEYVASATVWDASADLGH
jgi:hypothetical protein